VIPLVNVRNKGENDQGSRPACLKRGEIKGMGFLDGLIYNFRGLGFSMRSPKLLFWGLFRFAAVVLITIFLASLILIYHQEILNLIWAKPESYWVLWLWHLLSWLLSLFMVALAAVISYLVSQVLFSVLIMDYMSRITEKRLTGRVQEPEAIPLLKLFFLLVGQEIPRTVVPVLVSILIMISGWFVLLGPVLLVLSSATAAIFLAWDNSDLVPARRLVPFRARLRFLAKTLPFHLGFGLPFLVPGLNILLLSFAPVGATLYYVGKVDRRES
jgi:CysZ protein